MKFIKERKAILILLGLSILLIPIGYLILNPEIIGMCPGWYEWDGRYECFSNAGLGWSLINGASYLIAPLAILLLFPQAFRAWRRFALFSVPITVFFIIYTPIFIGEGIPGSISSVEITRFWGIIFLVISLIIIFLSAIIQHFKT